MLHVQLSHNKRKPVIRVRGANLSSKIKAVPRRKIISAFVGRLDNSTSEDDLVEMLSEAGVNGVKCNNWNLNQIQHGQQLHSLSRVMKTVEMCSLMKQFGQKVTGTWLVFQIMDSDITDNLCIRVVSFNLHGYKNNLDFLQQLLSSNDIVFVQELWLYDSELPLLSMLSNDFIVYAQSGMTNDATQEGMIRGRPFGGVAVFIRKSFCH